MRSSNRRRAASVLAAIVVGLVLVTAYNETVANAPQTTRTRQGLLSDIRQGTASTQQLDRQAQALRQQVSADRSSRLSTDNTGAAVAARLKQLELTTGLAAATGPGVIVSVADGPTPKNPTPGAPTLWRVQDTDLQGVVNALWALGAEAISVNGERLSPLSTIRSAGGAILVDFEPVSSPYEVKAIGDPKALPTAYAQSLSAVQLRAYNKDYGIKLTITAADSMALPAAATPNLRFAKPPGSTLSGPASPQPSDASSGSGTSETTGTPKPHPSKPVGSRSGGGDR
ncbi:DUF881 domain-containing protein [Fodinicola feengrottensis]|uniref:DUF881 domain-containing protein n=1 Tax=Fodinicola feengrottensis TaxID=435914 RepID=UPI0013D399F0|nr:DUF881 domain-containing protein [Fodinicola feengrottensis]